MEISHLQSRQPHQHRRITKRTWARTTAGGTTRLATIYTPDAFGEITNIDYTKLQETEIIKNRLVA